MIELKPTLDLKQCTYCGKCLYNCPLYDKYEDQVYSARGKIILLRNKIKSDTLPICGYCNNCIKECPLNIDLPAYLLLEYWDKKFYKLNNVKKQSILILREKKELIFEFMTKKDFKIDLNILSNAKEIHTDLPIYFLFLKYLKKYYDFSFKILFLHKNYPLQLPGFMRGYAKKGDHFENIIFFEK